MAIFCILKKALEPRPSNEARVAAQFAGGRSVWHEPWDKLLPRVNVRAGHLGQYRRHLSQSASPHEEVRRRLLHREAHDVGIKLTGDTPVFKLVEGRLTLAGSWNSMVTHRVRIADAAELDAELLAWLREAYDRAA